MNTTLRRIIVVTALVGLGVGGVLLSGAAAHAQDADALRAKGASLRAQLAASPFRRPVLLESVQTSGDLRGEVHAVVAQSFAVASPALQRPAQWCELLILHLNVKQCDSERKSVALVVGRKSDAAQDHGYPVEFAYELAAATPDYLRVEMTAEQGPLGTRNYRLTLEAVPMDAGTTFIHMSYAYSYGTAARLAMQAYLATVGRDKVGFSVTGTNSLGRPIYIDGVRGVLERNTMRYYLAIDAYLGALGEPPARRQERRLKDWFDATERYPVQLHELERAEYMSLKLVAFGSKARTTTQ